MISGSNYSKKVVKNSLSNEKKQQFSQVELKSASQSIFSQRNKIKPKAEREKLVVKDQTHNGGMIKKNQLTKDPSQNEQSSVFSRGDKDKVKISVKKWEQYFKKVNANGFSTFPPSFAQISTPILIISMIVEIILVSWKCMRDVHTYIIFGVQCFLFILMTYFWFKTTSIIPTDSVQLQHLEFIRCCQISSFQPAKHKYFCNLCKTCIGQKSFHCNKCNRCVEYFDHHCRWLNNCIGAKNYIEFILLMVWSELFMLFFFICNTIFICKIVNENDLMPQILWYAVAMIILAAAPFIALSMLLCLHLYLVVAKRSTIELILQSRKKNKICPQNSNELHQKKSQGTYLPQQSSVNTPNLLMQNAILKDMNEQRNERLIKFMKNLSNNLNLGKTSSKQKESHLSSYAETQKKINFKPTILKKTASNLKANFKSNTVKINKVQIEIAQEKKELSKKQNYNHQEFTSDQSEVEQTGTNLVSKLRFSTKKQIFQEQLEIKTTRQNEIQKKKYYTERAQSSSRKQRYPKKLQPLNKHQTERKIKSKSKTKSKSSDIKNKEKALEQKFQNYQPRSKAKSQKKDTLKDIPVKKLNDTRLFKVLPSSKKQRYDEK